VTSRVRNIESVAVASLAGGSTIRDTAKVCGCSEKTIARRLKQPEFQQQVREARAALIDQALDKLTVASTEAADTLRELLKCAEPKVRLGAARTVIELGLKLRDAAEVEERIAQLEAALNAAPEEQNADEQQEPPGETGSGDPAEDEEP
jgi:hypothetical protein